MIIDAKRLKRKLIWTSMPEGNVMILCRLGKAEQGLRSCKTCS